MIRVTPVVYVEEIEPVLPFWLDRLGFTINTQIPEGDRLGFVILQKGAAEIMYQTRESIRNDLPQLEDTPMRGSFLFIQVDDIDDVERRLQGVERVVPRRKTFYGSEEVIVRDPAGNAVTFAHFEDEQG